MRRAGLRGISRRKGTRTTVRDARTRAAPDLVERDFTADAPDRLWVADITYIPTWAGFLYLAVVLDAFSRRVVGWSMANHLRTQLVLDALDMALWQRRPDGVIHHSDQGSQYTSLAFGKRCRDAGVRPSTAPQDVGTSRASTECDSAVPAGLLATISYRSVNREFFEAYSSIDPSDIERPATGRPNSPTCSSAAGSGLMPNPRMAVFEFIEGWYNATTAPLRHRISVTRQLRKEPSTPRPKSITVHETGSTPVYALLKIRRWRVCGCDEGGWGQMAEASSAPNSPVYAALYDTAVCRTSAGVSLIAAPRGRLMGGRHDGAGDSTLPHHGASEARYRPGLAVGVQRSSAPRQAGGRAPRRGGDWRRYHGLTCERTLRVAGLSLHARSRLVLIGGNSTRGAAMWGYGPCPRRRRATARMARNPRDDVAGKPVANRPLICSHRRSVARCRVPILVSPEAASVVTSTPSRLVKRGR